MNLVMVIAVTMGQVMGVTMTISMNMIMMNMIMALGIPIGLLIVTRGCHVAVRISACPHAPAVCACITTHDQWLQ